jgi:hypothetical protein
LLTTTPSIAKRTTRVRLADAAGGERAAAIYSVLGSAKLNGLDPELYIRHVLERIADHPVNRIHEFLPWNLASELPNHLGASQVST